jgi:hypothetical protein
VRSAIAACAVLLALLSFAHRVEAANDASVGYETIRPSLVKVWAFDRSGKPDQSGTGVIVDSDDRVTHILTATHVVAGAASIRIDVSRDVHDLVARVERNGPRDLTLLTVDRGGLRSARFAPRTRAVVEGNLVAVAGYVKNDELIGIVGQEPRILFPGTVAARPDNGLYLELENVHIEEGLSGGAVFDPATGDVLGIVTSRTSDRRGGFADSGAFVVLPFLNANRIAGVQPPPAPPARAVLAAAPPRITVPPHLSAPQHLDALPLPLPLPLPRVAAALSLPSFVPRPMPTATLLSVIGKITAQPANGIVAWQAQNAQPKRFVVVRGGCRIALTIDVQTLQFVIAHQALVTPRNHGSLFAIALQQRAGTGLRCDNVDDTEPMNGSYAPTAMAYDGHHVTMRFTYAGDAEDRDLFPADASLDADLDGDAVTATVSFFANDWNGSISLPLAHTPLAAVSSTW